MGSALTWAVHFLLINWVPFLLSLHVLAGCGSTALWRLWSMCWPSTSGPTVCRNLGPSACPYLRMSLWWSSCHSSSAHPLPKLMSFLVCILFLCVVRKLFFQGLVNGQRFPVTVTRVTCFGLTPPATRSPSLWAVLVWLWRGSLCKDPASQGSCLCRGPVTDPTSGGGPALLPPRLTQDSSSFLGCDLHPHCSCSRIRRNSPLPLSLYAQLPSHCMCPGAGGWWQRTEIDFQEVLVRKISIRALIRKISKPWLFPSGYLRQVRPGFV